MRVWSPASTLVCDSLDVVLPVITKLVNTTLTTAHFPTEWKQVIVNPLLKKGAKDVTHKNLRPISNLQFVSKITERAVFDQVYSHMTDNELFPVLQSAFGITDAALAWFSWYLSGRSKRVSLIWCSSRFVSWAPTLQCLCQRAIRGHQVVPAQRTRIRWRYSALSFLQPRQLP